MSKERKNIHMNDTFENLKKRTFLGINQNFVKIILNN